MTSEENIKRLCVAIDSLADARANLAVVQYHTKSGAMPKHGVELDAAVKVVTEARQRLETVAIEVLR